MSRPSTMGSRAAMAVEAVQFYSDGEQVAGDLYLPEQVDDVQSGRPAVIFCHGWGGTKAESVGAFAERLTAQGFAVLGFDYRGYGASGGRRNRLVPQEQALDIVAAAHFLRADRRIAPDRISVLGLLTGAGAALTAAACDESIAAVVCFYPFGDGARWLRAMRPWWQWVEFLEQVRHDRALRSTTGSGELLDPSDVFMRDPEARRRELVHREKNESRGEWRLGFDSVDAILAFAPERDLQGIPPRAVMVVAATLDLMMPIEEVLRLWEHVEEPRRLLVLEGVDHQQVYEPERLTGILNEVGEFLADAMPPVDC